MRITERILNSTAPANMIMQLFVTAYIQQIRSPDARRNAVWRVSRAMHD